ncbi:hypothetical protein QO003_002268 [Arthrobacter silviterrae]|uniref:Uncharacterized protein n=1 Tax=Arthrobacter silviterrae TaxID=2026658 RepID=A0ABX0D9E0_9MICC|nr:hypothetical protein [Arthrobacter silviterrae]MDQ0277965.1 hypothetical protein [Arthrobacter silviterrae]NGN83519.1 hypothetical protein [Arthrobacter silviterrae]
MAGPTASATPTPKAAKQYSNDELMAMVKQIKPGSGTELTTASAEELAGANPVKALMSMFTVEPAECKELETLGSSEPVAGSTSAAGAEVNNESSVMTTVTLTSGVDVKSLQRSLDASVANAAKCATMTLSMARQSMTVATDKFAGIGTVPGTIAYRTAMSTQSGAAQSTYMAHAIKDGVLISVTASGKGAEASGAASAGALMDQAAALIK